MTKSPTTNWKMLQNIIKISENNRDKKRKQDIFSWKYIGLFTCPEITCIPKPPLCPNKTEFFSALFIHSQKSGWLISQNIRSNMEVRKGETLCNHHYFYPETIWLLAFISSLRRWLMRLHSIFQMKWCLAILGPDKKNK